MSYCRPDRLDTDEAQDLIGWFAHNLPVELRGKLMAERPLAYVKLFGTGTARSVVEHIEAAVQPCAACRQVPGAMIHRAAVGRPGEFVRRDGHEFAPFLVEAGDLAPDILGRADRDIAALDASVGDLMTGEDPPS